MRNDWNEYNMTNYQKQTRLVKIGRWLKHIPFAYIVFILKMISWIFGGCQPLSPFTRIQTVYLLYTTGMSFAKYRMGQIQPIDEWINKKEREKNLQKFSSTIVAKTIIQSLKH